jgi:hypothetical protein
VQEQPDGRGMDGQHERRLRRAPKSPGGRKQSGPKNALHNPGRSASHIFVRRTGIATAADDRALRGHCSRRNTICRESKRADNEEVAGGPRA